MQKSERRVTGLREKVLRIHSTCARVKVKTIQLFPGKDNNSERYRAVSCRIVPRAKKLLYLCTANETKTAIPCSIVQYRAVSCSNVQ